MGQALSDYLHKCKSPETYMSLRTQQNDIRDQRIKKCNETIRKCQLEKQRLIEAKRRRIKKAKHNSCFSVEENTEAETQVHEP